MPEHTDGWIGQAQFQDRNSLDLNRQKNPQPELRVFEKLNFGVKN